MFKKFEKSDLLYNTIKTYPKVKFYIYNRDVYYNCKPKQIGTLTTNLDHVPVGYVSLDEMNVDRPSGQLIYPYITKDGNLLSFSTISTTEFNENFNYGDTLTGSYPLSASISKDYYIVNQSRPKLQALQNTLNYYLPLSQHYAYTSSLGYGNKGSQEIGILNIPSIFYGSSIKKGTVDLKFFVTGTLIAQLQDLRQNGELIQTNPVGSVGSGSIAGVVLYNEGFLVLTGAWQITQEHLETYVVGGSNVSPKWVYFANTGSVSTGIENSLFELNFQGTQKISTITMFAHAAKSELNHSNNPTYRTYNQGFQSALTSSKAYVEYKEQTIKNITKSPHEGHTASFEKTTYISKIGIYDQYKNLIAVAKLAKPIRKREEDNYTFKLKLDI